MHLGEKENQWIAEEGMMLVCKINNNIYGDAITLGNIMIDGEEVPDTIDNYIEVFKPTEPTEYPDEWNDIEALTRRIQELMNHGNEQ